MYPHEPRFWDSNLRRRLRPELQISTFVKYLLKELVVIHRYAAGKAMVTIGFGEESVGSQVRAIVSPLAADIDIGVLWGFDAVGFKGLVKIIPPFRCALYGPFFFRFISRAAVWAGSLRANVRCLR